MVDLDQVVSRSSGVFVSQFRDGAMVYDSVAQKAHRVGPLATWVLENDRGPTLNELIDDVVSTTGATRAEAAAALVSAVDELWDLGLLGRTTAVDWPQPVNGSTLPADGRIQGLPHAVHDRTVAFRSRDVELLSEIDNYLEDGSVRAATTYFDVDIDENGGVRLNAADLWEFPNRTSFFVQLPGVLNDFAVRSHTSAILHAGGARTPDGRVLLITGCEGAGKSTLTAALVQQGCDYLSDEMIGIKPGSTAALPFPKPIELDPVSRTALGLPDSEAPYTAPREVRTDTELLSEAVGPIHQIVMPIYDAGHGQATAQELDPEQAIKTLLGNVLNLLRSGESGLRAICELAEGVAVRRIVHSDSTAVAASLLSESAEIVDRRI